MRKARDDVIGCCLLTRRIARVSGVTLIGFEYLAVLTVRHAFDRTRFMKVLSSSMELRPRSSLAVFLLLLRSSFLWFWASEALRNEIRGEFGGLLGLCIGTTDKWPIKLIVVV